MNKKDKIILGAVAGLLTVGTVGIPSFADNANGQSNLIAKAEQKQGFFSRIFGGKSEEKRQDHKGKEMREKESCKGKDGCESKDKDKCKGQDKDSCKGKDKDSCKGKDKDSCKGKDKDSCKGKDGCEGKDRKAKKH